MEKKLGYLNQKIKKVQRIETIILLFLVVNIGMGIVENKNISLIQTKIPQMTEEQNKMISFYEELLEPTIPEPLKLEEIK